MQLVAVTSSNIAAIGHDPVGNKLHIRFKGEGEADGPLWEYDGVPADTHAALMAADSVGGHFHRHIKRAYQGNYISA